ncbi:hypothetical protein V7S43_004103 [Phytophthora oleae]|uniref:BZIP domain-containing protein n=1 Tax=Phytophthora oleae TaxID=2107226 RepID=A0ABD3FVZ9_9STRA
MTDLITPAEVLFDDIVGLLDFNAPLTPRGFESESTAHAGAFTIPSPSHVSPSGVKGDKRVHKREMEKTRQRRYRQKLKDVRDKLQQQVDELSLELLQLSEQKSKRKQLKASHKTRQLSKSQWALVADRQREQRVHSEEEYKKLLAAVRQQAEYIKGLRQVAGDVLCFANIPTRRSMTSSLYMTYLQQLEGCYARVDRVMDTYSMETLPETTHNSTQRRQEDEGVSFFNHLNKTALPYSFSQTCEALWTAIHEQDEPAFGDYETAPDDDVFIKSRVLRSLNVGHVGQLVQRFISRFYKEKERLVIVWKMSSEGEGDFSGLHAEETAWMSVRPTQTGVMLEVCVQQVPMRFNSASNKEPAVAKFYSLLQESLEADKNKMVTCLGKVLLDGVLTGIDC